MKKYFILAAAALAFAACTSDDLTVGQPEVQTVPDNAVAFDAYINRAVTRAGDPGSLVTSTPGSGEIDLKTEGFGVFAYYTDNNNYDQQALPNFMYNQKVETASWTYTPVKYWPNEYGTSAISDDFDKISFFAYAPWVDVVAATGKPTKTETDANPFGIQSLSRNTATGDPIVKYQATFATNMGVDICWGVCDQDVWPLVQTGQNQTSLEKGKPWLDVQRPADPSVNQKMKFTFKHATAKLNVQINHFTDGYDNTEDLKGDTRIWVRSITFTGFAMEGALNLNNTEAYKPLWLSYCCDTEMSGGEEVTIYDGRKDGKEGVVNALATNEKNIGLNPQLVQTENAFDYADPTVWNADPDVPQGVTITSQNLFAKWDKTNNKWYGPDQAITYTDPIYVIPTDDDVEVEIVYDVETIDKKLSDNISDGKTHGSTIQNRIRKKINFGSITKLEAGKAYTIQLHLGMNSVKFDAVVTDWDKMEPGSDIDLPANMPQFAAFTSGSNLKAEIPGGANEYVFAVTGLTGGETIQKTGADPFTAVTVNSKSDFATGAVDHANPSGVAYVKVTSITANQDVVNKKTPDAITITGAHGKKVVLDVTQLAEALNLTTPTFPSDLTIQLTRTGAITSGNWYTGESKKIRVWRNEAELAYTSGSLTADNQFTYDGNGLITLKKTITSGEIFKIYLQTGDVPAETISVTK